VGTLVDWNLAASTGVRLIPKGPSVDAAAARHTVSVLRKAAISVRQPVAETSHLTLGVDGAASVAVVDRPTWLRSNVQGVETLLGPLEDALAEKVRGAPQAVSARVTAVQLGGVLAWVSARVLGQYEAFPPAGESPRLLLVAPNVRAAAQSLDLPEDTFSLWVALHEHTHLAQFASVDWLGPHLRQLITDYLSVGGQNNGEALRRLRDILVATAAVLRGRGAGATVLEALHTEQQQEVFDRTIALMTLVEGHADWVTAQAASKVMGDADLVRDRLAQRRARRVGPSDSLLRRLLGLDAKLQQYSDGEAFVTALVAKVGVDGMNAVWASPDMVPTRAEITEPNLWLARVHG
jgi:coenzyme F420 biosynthesis associated uncharacterized protein